MEEELIQEQKKMREKMAEFRKSQADQLEKNKKLREEQVKREFELDNVEPTGQDLMHELYKEKEHISYQKQRKNDKILSLMKDKLEQGDTEKRR